MEEDQYDEVRPLFPVVGLGASAGGLDALNVFFQAMPANSGMAFIVVQHLAHHQESILHELIQRHTKINVKKIKDDTVIQPNIIYVLPAGHMLSILENRLHLTPMLDNKGWPETINGFFQSLALDRGEKAAVIVLSGAGYDGTEGARVIKTEGGLVIAQDLDTASQSSMPFSVIDAGLATVVLSPDLMPTYLLSHFEIDIPEAPQFEDLTEVITDEGLQRVIEQLRQRTSYDFGDYKVSTLRRQIARRMGAYQVNTVDAYLDLLQKQGDEANQLVKGLLIHVTSFFRDPNAFDALKTDALLPVLETFSIDDVFRVWVPGCASGEEAISLAILIYECLIALKMPEIEVRIFATDINHDLVQRARRGIYPPSIAEQMGKERLKDNFIEIPNGYQVRSHISRMIVWAEHNMIDHPPFSGLHLISCRNVMIYFQPQLQERIRALFQFALRPQGILFLGSSEAMPEAVDMFDTLNGKYKIYRRISGPSHHWMRLNKPLFSKVAERSEKPMTAPKPAQRTAKNQKLNLIKETLLSYYGNVCAIVDEHYRIRFTYGDIDAYLRLVPGDEVQTNILSMAREGLDAELTVALYEAFDKNESVRRYGVSVNSHGNERLVNLVVIPMDNSELGNRYKLVIFEPVVASEALQDTTTENTLGEEGATITRLREERLQAYQALQSATQALQAKSEELTTSMEEISSSNEEVQTTNEELRTSKEELESMNEELNTLNTQLGNQNFELTHANNTLHNFLQSTAIGVIFLDQKLCIRTYTQAVTRIFPLRKSDIGRPLLEVTTLLKDETLTDDLTQVLNTLVDCVREVSTTEGDWYKLEIRPYRTMNNVVDGLVLTFTDITIQKQAQLTAEQTSLYVRRVVDTVDHGLLELDGKLHVVAANTAFYTQFHVDPEDTIGRSLYDLGNGQWDIPDLRRLLNEIIPRQTIVSDYTLKHDFPEIGRRTMRLNAHQIKEMDRILLVITDLSEDEPE